jgi:acetyl-CoA carboxylase carboxyl transferase subunit alpha
MQLVNDRLERHLSDLRKLSVDELLAARYEKFRNIAQFYTTV